MAIANFVEDTITSTGTGDITLAGTPPSGSQGLSAIGGVGTTFPYALKSGANAETGTGTVTGTNTFSRNVKTSTNGNAAINVVAGATFKVALTAEEYLSGPATFTNKRITARNLALGSGATPAINTDLYDRVTITGLAVNITGFTMTGTPVEGDTLTIAITDNGTGRTLFFGSSFEASTINPPTATVGGQKLTSYWEWNSAGSKWRCMGYA